MTRRTPFPFYVSIVLVGLAACGGRAASGDSDSELPGVDVPGVAPNGEEPSTDVPAVEVPSSDVPAELQALDLRLFDESNQVGTGLPGCEYSQRMRVNFRLRELSSSSCEYLDGGFGRVRESMKLLDSDLEHIRTAYSELRVVSGTQCKSSADRMSLAVASLDDAGDLQLLDAEHSGCPLEGVDGEAFVQGLEQLYRLLAEL